MKRGKDFDKIMGPMFPRLHVNDTDKGGPRAPPRNKMALYEQLSIPSQRFNPDVLPRNSSNTSDLAPTGSSSQGSGLERHFPYPHYVPPPTPNDVAEKYHSCQPDGRNLNTPVAPLMQRKKVGEEDDFTVPVFVHSGKGQGQTKMQTSAAQEKLASLCPNYLGHSSRFQNAGDNDHFGSTGLNLRRDTSNQSEDNLEVCVSSTDHIARHSTNLQTREKNDMPEEGNASQNQQYQNNLVSNFTRLHENDTCLQQETSARLQSNHSEHGDHVPESRRQKEKINIFQPGNDSHLRKDCSSPNEPEIDSECFGDKTCGSLQFRNGDKSNDASETSMVDSISVLDISPDDVVGIIGQKHFWKARRAIANQQRVFSVQVFELHRLIKVQQLIAGSPHLLLEEEVRLAKPPLKGSPCKNLPSECVVTPPVHVAKHKDNSENPNHKMECSAENAVEKTPFTSVNNGQPPNFRPHAGLPTVPMAADTKMAPWCFHPSPGLQWLVPVMSPSEGLVYKPYTAPGFMGSGCGGCGPFGPIPLTGNFMTSAYGVPTSHYHQGIEVSPGAPPVDNACFPPYGMPGMNPAISGSAGSGSCGQTAQFPGGILSSNMPHQSSCNERTQKSEAVLQGKKLQASKNTSVQGSTGSSPSGRVQGVGTVQAADGRAALPPFPVTTPCPEGSPQHQETDQLSKVIKVVPHNGRSATESAARIFQSIQEGRKQYDSL
ncbi:PREDICTED: protein EARLY FLOWERING 3 [Populus euphratica]|uniref:Protein EARLY FLOWERING 3 n=1 Tax=Populus euphratica TaxID=75702 RepID=A0AAJ6XI58_POPEU|nr:PREDICTED: protein EARLY FLOWERING 3 [Populus euphratica]